MRPRRPHERGFALIIVTGVVTMLLAAALVVLGQANDAMAIAGGQLTGHRARSIAQTGASWGAQQLVAVAYPNGLGGALSLSNIRALPRVPNGSLLCGDGARCSDFYLLSGADAVASADGSYQVAVTCNPGACTSAPSDVVNFELRALALIPHGGRSLIEITYAPQ